MASAIYAKSEAYIPPDNAKPKSWILGRQFRRVFAEQEIHEMDAKPLKRLNSLFRYHSGSASQLRDGFAGVERSFVAMLERHGIKRVDPTGTAFDAANHQSMAEQGSSLHPPGTVLEALTPAWTLNGRLLRPAMVVVAKNA